MRRGPRIWEIGTLNSPRVLLIHDGELEDVRWTLEAADVAYQEVAASGRALRER